MRAELSALWKAAGEDDISSDNLINAQDSYTPDLYDLWLLHTFLVWKLYPDWLINSYWQDNKISFIQIH